MTKIFLALVFLSNVCFALPSEDCEHNLEVVWQYSKSGYQKRAIAFCTEMIENPTVSYIDKTPNENIKN